MPNAGSDQASQPLSWLRDPAARLEPSLLSGPQEAAWTGFRLGIFRAGNREVTAQHGDHPVVAMIRRGRTHARIRSFDDDCEFSPGTDSVGLFAPRYDISWSRWECEPGAERMMIELDFSNLERHGDLNAMLPPRRALRQNLPLRDRQLAGLMRLIAHEVRQGCPHGAIYSNSLSIGLATYLLNQHAIGGPSATNERGVLTAPQLDRVLELVHQRLGDNLGLDDLAAAAGVSRFHFLRLFKIRLPSRPFRISTTVRAEGDRNRSRPVIRVSGRPRMPEVDPATPRFPEPVTRQARPRFEDRPPRRRAGITWRHARVDLGWGFGLSRSEHPPWPAPSPSLRSPRRHRRRFPAAPTCSPAMPVTY